MTADPNWWASGPGRSMCKKCGEEKLVDEIADGRGVQNFCAVCCHSWWLSGPLSADDYRMRRFTRYEPRADVNGVEMNAGE